MRPVSLDNQKEIQRNLTNNNKQLAALDSAQADFDIAQANLNKHQHSKYACLGLKKRTQATRKGRISRFSGSSSRPQARITSLPPKSTLINSEKNFKEQLKAVEKELTECPGGSQASAQGLPCPDYFLTVTTTLKQDSRQSYIEGMTKLLEDFAWDFIAAGEHQSEHEIMNLWRFGDANDLYRQMVGLAGEQAVLRSHAIHH